jgi:hypothetical protein
MKDCVKADVAKAEFIHSELELRLAVIANQRARIVRPNRQIEEAIYRPFRVFEIHENDAGRGLLRLSRRR